MLPKYDKSGRTVAYTKLPSFISFFLIWNGFALTVYMFYKHRHREDHPKLPNEQPSSGSQSNVAETNPFIRWMWRYPGTATTHHYKVGPSLKIENVGTVEHNKSNDDTAERSY